MYRHIGVQCEIRLARVIQSG